MFARWVVLAAALASSLAAASDYDAYGQTTTRDAGLTVGYNSPAGGLGVELEWRPIEYVGLALHGGTGLWGLRASPVLRLYPAGLRFGLFAEGAVTGHLGGESDQLGPDRDLLLAPMFSAGVAVGHRQRWEDFLFTAVKVGYQWRLEEEPFYSAGTPVTVEEHRKLEAMRPGGFVVAVTAGISL